MQTAKEPTGECLWDKMKEQPVGSIIVHPVTGGSYRVEMTIHDDRPYLKQVPKPSIAA